MIQKERKNKTPYSQRTDIEKIRANWIKTLGLFERGEFSVAVVRAAVALELAVNFAVRQELVVARKIDDKFTDHLLGWANGVKGKFTQLLLPVNKGTDRFKPIEKLFKKTKLVNTQRNSVAHSGQFKTRKTALAVIESAHSVITELVCFYESSFSIKTPEDESLVKR